jgi:hypothetical protein
MYEDTYYDYKQQCIKDMIENEMQRTRDQALRNLSSVVHFETETFTKVLAYSYFEEQEDALRLADQLNLCKLDFLAIVENFDRFKDEYYKDLELAQNF